MCRDHYGRADRPPPQVVFAIYTHYLIRFVQTPSPQSELPLEKRNELFHRILHIGLAYPIPLRPTNPDDDPDVELEQKLYEQYETGQVSVAGYHHLRDREYEHIHGMQVKRRVGKMTEEDRGVIEAFVEEEPGEREERLREQVERDVGEADVNAEGGIVGEDGKTMMLHPMDRRAVEFRERLRPW